MIRANNQESEIQALGIESCVDYTKVFMDRRFPDLFIECVHSMRELSTLITRTTQSSTSSDAANIIWQRLPELEHDVLEALKGIKLFVETYPDFTPILHCIDSAHRLTQNTPREALCIDARDLKELTSDEMQAYSRFETSVSALRRMLKVICGGILYRQNPSTNEA